MKSMFAKAYEQMAGFMAKSYKRSYAQCGEDLIIQFIFESLNISKPTYLDIGAHHPIWLSNTYLFYENGSSGVCVDADPDCHAAIRRERKRDICLNIGIGVDGRKHADFFIMTSRTLNTFSREEAQRCQNTPTFGDQKIERIIQVPMRSIDEVMIEHFPKGANLISLDVEGMDFDILRSLNFGRFRPDVFCVETLRCQDDGSLRKIDGLLAFMKGTGYRIYADTYINTIFVSEQAMAVLEYSRERQSR